MLFQFKKFFKANNISITFEIVMKRFCIGLITLSLSSYNANAFFFNLGYFLEPIIKPEVDTFGSTIYHDRGSDNLIPFDQRHGSNQNKNIAESTKLYSGHDQRRKKNLRAQELKPAQDLYKTIGIPQDVIYDRILPVHMKVRRSLHCYFYRFCTTNWELYRVLKELKQMIEWIQQTYLKDVNNVVIGDNTEITGHNVYVAGGHQKIEGNSSFVFNPKFSNKVVQGDNIVRIDKFDIDLDQIEKVKWMPRSAIKILQK